jgi:predicted RNase H-like nuclease
MYNGFGEQTIYMGLFGFTWQEKVARYMYDAMKGLPAADIMRSFWQASGLNVRLVDNLHREYMAMINAGRQPVQLEKLPDEEGHFAILSNETAAMVQPLSNATGAQSIIVQYFLIALYMLAKSGAIGYEKLDPKGYAETEAARRKLEPTKDVVNRLLDFSSMAVLVGGIAAGAYLLKQLRSFR